MFRVVLVQRRGYEGAREEDRRCASEGNDPHRDLDLWWTRARDGSARTRKLDAGGVRRKVRSPSSGIRLFCLCFCWVPRVALTANGVKFVLYRGTRVKDGETYHVYRGWCFIPPPRP